jgi:hypothetical protein
MSFPLSNTNTDPSEINLKNLVQVR